MAVGQLTFTPPMVFLVKSQLAINGIVKVLFKFPIEVYTVKI
jgi:hypothetical protein